MFKRKSSLYRILKKHPGEMYVTDNLIAVLLPNDQILAFTGDFKGITEEEANLKLQNALDRLLKS